MLRHDAEEALAFRLDPPMETDSRKGIMLNILDSMIFVACRHDQKASLTRSVNHLLTLQII
jgi:hypothetical protein